MYRKIDEEMKQLKDRLRKAGVNRIVAGIDATAEAEEEEEEGEEYNDDDDPVAKAERQLAEEERHVP